MLSISKTNRYCLLNYTITKNIFLIPLIIYTLGVFLSINNSVLLNESITAYLQVLFIFLFAFYRITIRPSEDNPDSTFTPLPKNITPLGMELDPDTGVDLSNVEKSK